MQGDCQNLIFGAPLASCPLKILRTCVYFARPQLPSPKLETTWSLESPLLTRLNSGKENCKANMFNMLIYLS